VALTTHYHLAPRLKKEYGYAPTPLLGLRGLLQSDYFYHYFYLKRFVGGFDNLMTLATDKIVCRR
jgi:hypothetical protein